ncbi:MAG: hypothetical protein PVH91_14110 [Pseudomonadales bacterium]|jgi:hypothetical protein
MDEPNPPDGSTDDVPDRNTSRLQLLIDVVVFQFKLAADGLRDLLLVPLTIASAVLGLIAGGDDPHRYFRDVLRLGRRSELWINLFGHRSRSGTSDDLLNPIKERVMTEAQSNPWISRAGGELNRKLDHVSEKLNPGEQKRDGRQTPETEQERKPKTD